MRINHICQLLALQFLLFPFQVSRAELIEMDDPKFGSGSITLDTETYLEWLDLTESQNYSFNEISGEFGHSGEFEGFRLASPSEIGSLFESAGISLGYSEANVNPCLFLIELVGSTATGVDGYPRAIGNTSSYEVRQKTKPDPGLPTYVIVDVASMSPAYSGDTLEYGATLGEGANFGDKLNGDIAESWLANWLVRESESGLIIDFTYSPEEPLVGQMITLDASSSYDRDGIIELFQWVFGDGEGEMSTDSITTHTYKEPGIYTVTLTVTDNDDHKASASRILIISELFNPIEQPEMGFLVGEIDFNDLNDFVQKIQGNNFENPNNPEYSRIHVEYLEGLEPDPEGLMRLQNHEDLDPVSPSYGQIISARAKGSFGQCDNSRVLIRFSYLFEISAPSLELVVYLSNVPELLDQADPQWGEHNIEIGRISVPQDGRPGSIGSGRFGTFETWVSTGLLDLRDGIWVELKLIENQTQLNRTYSLNSINRLAASANANGSVLVDDWTVEVHCDGICLDLNWSDVPDEEDLLLVIASCGESASLLEGGIGSRVCLDGPFSTDGFVDSFDIASWDWALSDEDRPYRLNLCKVPIAEDISVMSLASDSLDEGSTRPISVMGLPNPLSDLLIVGKRETSEDPFALKSKDRLYAFTRHYQYRRSFDPEFDRCSIRLVKGPEGDIYQINSERGVVRLDTVDEVIVPPGQTTYSNEPRYNEPATAYIGIQDGIKGPFGRPVLDAAFDANYVYIVPVVVNPDREDAYLTAAKLQLLDGQNPPYQVVRLYDDPPAANDNQHRNHLREIEIDGAGNIYVINAHSDNESDILWKYGPDGMLLKRVDLGDPNNDNHLRDPIAMHVSDITNMVYITSGQKDKNPDSKSIYCFSKDQMILENIIEINGMRHVTDITEDPAGTLWIVGFNMIEDVPDYPDPTQPSFYYPCLAKVASDGGSAEVTDLVDSSDLGLPMSIVWTGDN